MNAPAEKRQPGKRFQLLAPDFVRAMLAGHSALGLAFAALIYVVCLTGTLSVFLHDFRRWEQPDAPRVTVAPSPEMVGSVLATAYAEAARHAAVPDIFVSWDGRLTPHFFASYHDHKSGGETEWLVNARGELAAKAAAPWSEFLVALHMQLHLPRTWGLALVGLTGVALLASLISGLLSHPRIFRDAFALRLGGSVRLQEADLHNRLGVWGLPFHFAVSLSGALLGLSVLIVGVLALAAYDGDSEKAFAEILGPHATSESTAAPLPDVVAMMARVREEHPGARLSFIQLEHAGTAGQLAKIAMQSPGHLAFYETYFFDRAGKSLGNAGFEAGSLGQQILGALQPLHFGWFGGVAIKLVYGLLGLALTIVTHSGVAIWLARRRDSGRPAPRWERLWAALAWSQPLALSVVAILALTNLADMLLAGYLGAVVATLVLGLWTADRRACVGILRQLATVGLVIVVATHLVIWGGRGTDPMAWIVNGTLLLVALAIGLTTAWRQPWQRSDRAPA